MHEPSAASAYLAKAQGVAFVGNATNVNTPAYGRLRRSVDFAQVTRFRDKGHAYFRSGARCLDVTLKTTIFSGHGTYIVATFLSARQDRKSADSERPHAAGNEMR